MAGAEKYLVKALPWCISGHKAKSDEALKAREKWPASLHPQGVADLHLSRLVSESGSQNIPLLAAACGLGVTYHDGDKDLHDALLDAWGRYASLPWMGKETGCRDIYGSWIHAAVMVAYAFAVKAGREDVGHALFRILRTSAAVMALGSGLPGTNKLPAVTVCGSRSAIASRDGTGHRMADDGMPNELQTMHSSMSTVLGRLGYLQPRPEPAWLDEIMKACRRTLGVDPYLSDKLPRRALRRIVWRLSAGAATLNDDLGLMVSWLERGPLPVVPLEIITTTEGAATVMNRSAASGSTASLYACAWHRDGRPASSSLNHYPWARRHPNMDVLFVDPPLRGKGRAGEAEVDLDNRIVSARTRTTKAHLDDRSQEMVSGWKTMPLPAGEVLWHVRFGPKGVQVLRSAVS